MPILPCPETLDESEPLLRAFSRLTDAELRDRKQLLGFVRALNKPGQNGPAGQAHGRGETTRETCDAILENGLFIAESRNVIERALSADVQPLCLLVEQRWRAAAEELLARIEAGGKKIPLYAGTHEQVQKITGYAGTRGPLAAFVRPPLPQPEALLANATRIAVLEDVANYTNLGAIFRSAAALGMDAVLITPGCHDPLYRRAARVSMGTVFQVPWARIGSHADWAAEGMPLLQSLGFTVAAMALRRDSVRLQDPRIAQAEKLALALGTEGEGLRESTIAACDHTVTIPMSHGVDSLNVGAAAAIAFWEACGRAFTPPSGPR